MGHWEANGASDEWYTPKYIFDALGCRFALDVASPPRQTNVPCSGRLTSGSLDADWHGFVWMNPPFGGRNGLTPWLEKFVQHGNGIALVPDRTSARWFQYIASHADCILFLSPKVKFERPDGTLGKSPSTGTALIAIGDLGTSALATGAFNGLGFLTVPSISRIPDIQIKGAA